MSSYKWVLIVESSTKKIYSSGEPNSRAGLPIVLFSGKAEDWAVIRGSLFVRAICSELSSQKVRISLSIFENLLRTLPTSNNNPFLISRTTGFDQSALSCGGAKPSPDKVIACFLRWWDEAVRAPGATWLVSRTRGLSRVLTTAR